MRKETIIDEIFDEFEAKRSKQEMSVDEMKKRLSSFSGGILLYGAGSSGIAFLYFLRRIGLDARFFVDADISKNGKKCEGVDIISPEQVLERAGQNSIIIVCINTDGKKYCKSFDEALRIGGHHAVYDRLHKAGCKNVIDYSYFRQCYSFFKNESYNAPACSDVDLMREHIGDIKNVYDMMEDKLSSVIFEKILQLRLLDDSIEIPTNSQDKQYFEYGFYPKRDDEIFIDCGAYNGISLRTFLKENNNKFAGYYGIEPDENNYLKLYSYVESLPEDMREKMTLCKAAAWNDDKGARLYALSGPGSFMADIGNQKTDTVRIDDLLMGKPATYIKMNIEGSEKEALEGAKYTIQRYKPKLAIAGYHRTDDMWKIPLMIKEYNKDYKIYLRSYMNHILFVYYCV